MPITSAAQPSPFCFNPRSPCGERRARRERRHLRGPVSTHAPLAGSDERGSLRLMRLVQFQPTLPLRGATRASRHRSPHPQCFNPRSPCGERRHQQEVPRHPGVVSTHAPLAGSDRAVRVRDPRAVRFQPTLPLRGATPPSLPAVSSSNLFQPTLPLRGATAPCPIRDGRRPSFNPRSPCGERRAAGGMTWRRHRSFNPRSPCGERRRGA